MCRRYQYDSEVRINNNSNSHVLCFRSRQDQPDIDLRLVQDICEGVQCSVCSSVLEDGDIAIYPLLVTQHVNQFHGFLI